MRILRKFVLVIGLASIVSLVSCATPTTPEFPKITCTKHKVSEKGLKELALCKVDTLCSVSHTTIKKIFDIVQAKSQCLEEYQAAASKFKG